MKLLRCSFNRDAIDSYFDPATRIVYAVRTWRRDKFDVCAFDATRDEDDQRIFASLSVDFATEAEALTELDRIAALISGEAAPAGESWVEGPPPKTLGAWFLVKLTTGEPTTIRFNPAQVVAVWQTPSGFSYGSASITHHLPTPIQPPKETDQ